jgi:lysophospholipase L1-like esterase
VGDDVPEGPFAGYPIRLQNRLGDATVLNRGRSGESTAEGLERVATALAGAFPGPDNFFLLMEGTNDISRGIPIEATLFNLEALADAALARGLSVAHATLIPRLPNAKIDRENLTNQELNQRIRHLAGEEQRLLIDPFEVLSSVPDVFQSFYWAEPQDPVGHPNAAGYDMVADAFYDVLTGIDSVPPVPGILDPPNGAVDISPTTAITVDIWDFGSGIDIDSIELRVNGEPVSATIVGNPTAVTVTHHPSEVLSERTIVSLRASDRASPANTFDRQIADFVVTGADLPPGDLDRNGRVDGSDLTRLETVFGLSFGEPGFVADYDINSDGVIDGLDLAIWAHNFGASI